jgi:hypothetical protein
MESPVKQVKIIWFVVNNQKFGPTCFLGSHAPLSCCQGLSDKKVCTRFTDSSLERGGWFGDQG